jgi:hypothetical protein
VPTQFKRVLQDTQLLRLNIGILVLHLLLTSLFVVLPIALKGTAFYPTPLVNLRICTDCLCYHHGAFPYPCRKIPWP